MEAKCICCKVIITPENDSKEHIFPRAIGGRRTVKSFLCKPCNGKFGETIDAEFARQFSELCLWSRISRQGNPPSPQDIKLTNGESMKLHADGQLTATKPHFIKTEEEGKITINAQTRSLSEAKKMFSQVQNRYPQLKEKDFKECVTEREVYPEGMIHTQLAFGGMTALRSVTKTALAYASYLGLDIDHFNKPISFMNSGENNKCILYYTGNDIITNRRTDSPMHCVSIICDPVSKNATCYVEYFSTWRLVVKLTDSYTGDSVIENYSINPLTGKEVKAEIDSKILLTCKSDLALLPNPDDLTSRLSAYIGEVYRQNQNAEFSRVVGKAMEKAATEMGLRPGDPLDIETAKELSARTTTYMRPYLEYLLKHLQTPFNRDE